MSQGDQVPSATLSERYDAAVSTNRIVLIAGLPAVGKSFHIKEFALAAHRAGRRVHLLQWDTSRPAFELGDVAGNYPTVDGATHGVIRKATGLWARDAIARWHDEFDHRANILIGELPLIGGRFVELTRILDDRTESLLAGDDSHSFIIVPTVEVRAHIEAARAASLANPSHEREKEDAPPGVVSDSWRETHDHGVTIGVAQAEVDPTYDPRTYAAVFSHILRHRNHEVISVDEIVPSQGSVYDLDVAETELTPTPHEVNAMFDHIEQNLGVRAVEDDVARWFDA